MAGKRRAGKELTHDNWDQEDESEDPGTFSKAADDIIQRRVIKRARHRVTATDEQAAGNGDAPKSAFAGFGGFSKTNQVSFKVPEKSNNDNSANKSLFSGLTPSNNENPTNKSLFTGLTPKFSFKPPSSTSLTSSSVSDTSIATSSSDASKKSDKSDKSDDLTSEKTPAMSSTNNSNASVNPANPNPEFSRHIQVLNKCFVNWITENIAKDASCILSPTFPDYDLHVRQITAEYPDPLPLKNYKIPDLFAGTGPKQCSPVHAVKPATTSPFSTKTTTSPFSLTSTTTNIFTSNTTTAFSFKPTTTDSADKEPRTQTALFSFKKTDASENNTDTTEKEKTQKFTGFFTKTDDASKKDDVSSTDKDKPAPFTGFGFGSGSLGSGGLGSGGLGSGGLGGATSGFGAGGFGAGGFGSGGTGFSFASAPVAAQKADDEEEYMPPKVEVKETEEEDSLFTMRCKLFYQKEGIWTDRGVGNVHLKEADGKCQLIVRADTNLATILLNIVIPESMPLSRQGKNNVSLLCVPNPPMDPKMDATKPVALLVRVKTGEMADQLLEKINEIRK